MIALAVTVLGAGFGCKARQEGSHVAESPAGGARDPFAPRDFSCMKAFGAFAQTSNLPAAQSLDQFLSGDAGGGEKVDVDQFLTSLRVDKTLVTLFNCPVTDYVRDTKITVAEFAAAALHVLNFQRKYYTLPEGNAVDSYRLLAWTSVLKGFGTAAAEEIGNPNPGELETQAVQIGLKAVGFSDDQVRLATILVAGEQAITSYDQGIVRASSDRTVGMANPARDRAFSDLRETMVNLFSNAPKSLVLAEEKAKLWQMQKLQFVVQVLAKAGNWSFYNLERLRAQDDIPAALANLQGKVRRLEFADTDIMFPTLTAP